MNSILEDGMTAKRGWLLLPPEQFGPEYCIFGV